MANIKEDQQKKRKRGNSSFSMSIDAIEKKGKKKLASKAKPGAKNSEKGDRIEKKRKKKTSEKKQNLDNENDATELEPKSETKNNQRKWNKKISEKNQRGNSSISSSTDSTVKKKRLVSTAKNNLEENSSKSFTRDRPGKNTKKQKLEAKKEESKNFSEGLQDEEEDEKIKITGDVCQFLMDRYRHSSAPQHQHLCAAAAAVRSLVLDDGLPLTPSSYFAAALTAIADIDKEDQDALSAISGFLSVLIPLVSPSSVPPRQAVEAAASVVGLLETSAGDGTAGPTVRALVGCLGLLALCVDLEDWASVELPLRMLLRFSLDRRPKIRKCAQLSVVRMFGALKSPIVIESSSNIVLSLFQTHIPTATKLSSDIVDIGSKNLEECNGIEVLHMLNTVKILVEYMPLSIARTFLSDVLKLLNGSCSVLTRNTVSLLEAILLKLAGDMLETEADAVVCLLTSFLSPEKKNPDDTLCSVSTLLRKTMIMLHNALPEVWIKHFSSVFVSLAGALNSSKSVAKGFADILKELIRMGFLSTDKLTNRVSLLDTDLIISMCSSVICALSESSCSPNEHILSVTSDLFNKLGKTSSLYMSDLVLKLSSLMTSLSEGTQEQQNVQQCLGSAIESMGPESILAIVPISFDSENKCYSNMWLVPILKQHTSGASLQYFLDHIVPLARSGEDKLAKAHRSSTKKKLLSNVDELWSLLPAFCNYPSDTADSFCSLSKILVQKLEKGGNSYDLVSKAIKELVNANKVHLEGKENQSAGKAVHAPFSYPKEVAKKNLEVLASNSMKLFKLFIDIFFASPPEKRVSIKDDIRNLASILGTGDLQNLFSDLPMKLGLTNLNDSGIESENCIPSLDEKLEEKTRLMVEISSAFVQGADQDFILMLFNYIHPHLTDTGHYQLEAFETLSEIIKGYPLFVSSNFDQLMDLLITTDSIVDPALLSCRLSCLHLMFVHLLKENEEKENNRALLILNEIIRLLKDSNEEVRKPAFDTLLNISQSLKNDCSTTDEHHRQLFQMIMSYLSGSPPQIMSVAIASISLLIYNDANIYFLVPDLKQTVLILLQNKANEVIKAVLGLIKVMASCLPITEIKNLLPDLINGISPWSSVSKNHFRSKVKAILEILLRKCGHDLVLLHAPNNYHGFVKLVIESKRKAKTASTAPSKPEFHPKSSFNARNPSRKVDPKIPEGRKRKRQHFIRETPGDKVTKSEDEKVRYQPKRMKFDSQAEKQKDRSSKNNKNKSDLKNKVNPAGKKPARMKKGSK